MADNAACPLGKLVVKTRAAWVTKYGWIGGIAQSMHDILIECQRLPFAYLLGDEAKCEKKDCYRQDQPRFRTPGHHESFPQKLHFASSEE
jgi:hypothetical protein